jgi:hypothetical protein
MTMATPRKAQRKRIQKMHLSHRAQAMKAFRLYEWPKNVAVDPVLVARLKPFGDVCNNLDCFLDTTGP